METLWSIATALGLPFGELVSPHAPEVRVVPAGEGVRIDSEGAPFLVWLLAATGRRGASEVYAIACEPGEPRRADAHPAGVREHILVTAGRMEVGPLDAPALLGPGDLATYAADVAHAYLALEPGTAAVLVMDYPLMAPVPLMQVDAFSERAFAGNPAAVCVLDGPAEAGWMQSLASEMNLSETAFLHREGGGYALRWFTPVAEVELCGHATLASAHALWESGRVAEGRGIDFATLSGTLSASRDDDWIVLDFPATPPEAHDAPAGLAEALGVAPRWTGRSRFDWFVELGTAGEVAGARPDMAALSALGGRGVILTAAGGTGGADITSRYFAPAYGIPEDPVTGSAHCALGPYWSARLGRPRLVCHQASARGGIVRVEPRGDRVLLGGRAVTVLEGHLTAGAAG